EGTVHHALPPYQPRDAADGVLRPQARGRPWRGWADVGGLPRRPRPSDREPARSGPAGSVPGVAITTTVHPESGWQPAPARGGRSRGQDRPEGDGRPAERDLRGRLPRVQLRVPARALAA